MESDEGKLKNTLDSSVTTNAAAENKDESSPAAKQETTNVGSVNAVNDNLGPGSRRSSASIVDDEECKRAKRRKGDNDNARKEDYLYKKDEHGIKKEDFILKNKNSFGSGGGPKLNAAVGVTSTSSTFITATAITATTVSTTTTVTAATSTASATAQVVASTTQTTISTTTSEISENDDSFKCGPGSPGPKVPPLKIVIPSVESEQSSSRNGKLATRHHGGLPYVVVSNDEIGSATSPSSPASNPNSLVKDEESSSSTTSEEQKLQQRVLRSTHSNRITSNNSGGSNIGTAASGSNDTRNSSNDDHLDPYNNRTNESNFRTSDGNNQSSSNTNHNVNSSGGSDTNNNNINNHIASSTSTVGSLNIRDSSTSGNNINNNGSSITSNFSNNSVTTAVSAVTATNTNVTTTTSGKDCITVTSTGTANSAATIVASSNSSAINTATSATSSGCSTTIAATANASGSDNNNDNNTNSSSSGGNIGSSNNSVGGNAGQSNGSGSSSNNGSETSGNSSPATLEMSPSHDVPTSSGGIFTKEDGSNAVKSKIDSKNSSKIDSCGATATLASVKIKSEPNNKTKNDTAEDDVGGSKSGNNLETRGTGGTTTDTHNKDSTGATASSAANVPVVELHPRKRKLKTKQEITHTTAETDHTVSFGSAPHPHEVPVTNCYQMFMDIRRQIDIKRKGLFPIQPKPPQGFKDYLMNRCTYTLAGNSIPRLKRRNAEPPEGIDERLKDLYQEQEAERYSLRMQHVVEKEKLVLSVEQEILRVHGRAARALANQALPFSACTILKDEEVYNVITPEQEEKDRNARSRYNGRLFISWLQDVDDKWEKIKEEMLARHHKEAESLNAVQKFNWDLKMRQLGLWKKKITTPIDESHVPMISVSDDFDLLPE